MNNPQYRLLDRFEALFQGVVYRHRSNTNGDHVVREFYEDLYAFARSSKYVAAVAAGTRVINTANRNHGINARRGDGAFGERLMSDPARSVKNFNVMRANIATIEIGAEAKIIATAGVKQIDRVLSDLTKQVTEFVSGTSKKPITLAVVGINSAPIYCGYEGSRTTTTDGSTYRHPAQDAPTVSQRIHAGVPSHYDHALILDFEATNIAPYAFKWVNKQKAIHDYTAMLTRISIDYDHRF